MSESGTGDEPQARTGGPSLSDHPGRTDPRRRLEPVLALLERRHLLRDMARREGVRRPDVADALFARQFQNELARRLAGLAPAEIADLFEMLPPKRRLLAWPLVQPEKAADVLAAIPETVATELIAATDLERLTEICRLATADDLHTLMHLVPEALAADLRTALATAGWVPPPHIWPAGTVGARSRVDPVVVPESATIKDALRAFRHLARVPEQTDKLFVVDAERRFCGVLPLETLLVTRPRLPIAALIQRDPVTFGADEDDEAAARTFERFDLVSAPVVDRDGRLVGRLTSDVVLDIVREHSHEDLLARDGLSGGEDLFGSIWPSARRRWLWLSVNLMTAFIASRVIGVFEDSIARLVALATLMPIVASVGGNTGNQTIALFVRGLALDQINDANVRYLAIKELAVSVINGLIWGSVMGVIAFALYFDWQLGLVMAAAVLLNLVLAAAIGIAVPLGMQRLGRDPALGSSVLLTFVTDSMGFFIFLGLASTFLLS